MRGRVMKKLIENIIFALIAAAVSYVPVLVIDFLHDFQISLGAFDRIYLAIIFGIILLWAVVRDE